jgi:1,4-dihydroxy-2-naphthoate polyprenyltransferase
MIGKLKTYFVELRSTFLTATFVSIILGTSIAWMRNGVFAVEFFVLTLVAGAFLHLGTNVANDYFDHKSGGDDINKEFVRPFSGGSRMIQKGLLTPREVLFEATILLIVGTAIGFYLAFIRGLLVLVLGLFGLFSGIFYASPPLKLANRGIGEVFVGLNFGVLMTIGAYFVQTQTLNVEPLVASIPVSLLIFAVVYINEFLDYNADKAIGKRTLVVRFGREKAARDYIILMAGVYLSILVGVLTKIMPATTLIALATFPIAIKATAHALKYHSTPLKLTLANSLSILCHLLTSLLLSVGYLIAFFMR